MLALLGDLGILAGLAGSVWLAASGWRKAARPLEEGAGLGGPLKLLVAGAVTAMLALVAALLANDFSLEYVANHHSRSTPFPFNVATAWAALEGSIVLWGVILAGYAGATYLAYRRRPDRLGAGALAVMGVIGAFFFGLMITVADPFRVCIEAGAASCLNASPWPWAAASAPADGPGPNPLLQNHILMAIHPPMLYLGYVGLSVPFAYAISGLALGQGGTGWLERSRRSTLVAWSFLSLGILLGGWWAYEVLSWGGYWAWDPVENASLMPWLVATAFIHSSLVQMRRGSLQTWNYVLVFTAFGLTILGTFLTRSGTIASVHSFTQSAIGPVLLGFLLVVLLGSFGLLAIRAPELGTSPRLESLFSREGAFLANNLVLAILTFVVLSGTLYPLVVEWLSGDQVGVGPPFFQRMAIPLAFLLLGLMAVGPLVAWGKGDPAQVGRQLHRPLQAALTAAVLAMFTLSRLPAVVGAIGAATFVIAASVDHLLTSAGRSAKARQGRLTSELGRVLAARPGYWAGQLSHIGVALVAVGIALSSSLALHAEHRMSPGDSVPFAGYQLHYVSPFLRSEPNRRVEGATIEVSKDGRLVTTLEPRAGFYGEDTTGITTPAVHSTLAGDLYLTLLSIDSVGIVLRAETSPGIWLIWLGGLTVAAGGVVSLSTRRRTRQAVLV
jgi:cytochrome c-type biogenesis protein CcmF